MPSVIKSVGCVHCTYFEELIPLRSTSDLTRMCRGARLPDTVIRSLKRDLVLLSEEPQLINVPLECSLWFQVHPSVVELDIIVPTRLLHSLRIQLFQRMTECSVQVWI